MRSLFLLLAACAEPKSPTTPSGDSGETTNEAEPDDGGDSGTAPVAGLAARLDGERLLGHLDALGTIGAAYADTRAAATDGHLATLDHLEAELSAAGLDVVRQPFSVSAWRVLGDPTLSTDRGGPFRAYVDYDHLPGTPGGTATGQVYAVEPVLPAPSEEGLTDSGCEVSDFTDMPTGAVALIQRGGCTFSEKVANAQAAGAVGVIIFNEGQEGRTELFSGTMDAGATIPTFAARTAFAEVLLTLMAEGPLTVTMEANAENTSWLTENMWVDVRGESDELLVVGAHTDSVAAGPGINDNGSGTALGLELALLAQQRLQEGGEPYPLTLRFAFWGAEELGLLGSFHYVESLDSAALDRHVANLNFDMLASPNGARFVYDGDGSADLGGFPAPLGSAEIESLFTDHFDGRSMPYEPTAFDGRSDYGPFILAGIPAGGLFSGAEQVKSASLAETYGGEAASPLDACYHRACDTRDNIDPTLYLELAEAAAVATETLAESGPFWSTPGFRPARGLPPGPSPLPYHGGCDRGAPRY